MLPARGSERGGPGLRWRDWPHHFVTRDRREIGRSGCPCRRVGFCRVRKFAPKRGGGFGSWAEEGRGLKQLCQSGRQLWGPSARTRVCSDASPLSFHSGHTRKQSLEQKKHTVGSVHWLSTYKTDMVPEQDLKQVSWAQKGEIGNGRWQRLFRVEGRACARARADRSRGSVARSESGEAGRGRVSRPVSLGKWELLKDFKLRMTEYLHFLKISQHQSNVRCLHGLVIDL